MITTRVSVLPLLLARGGGLLLDEATPEAVARAVETCLASAERYLAMSQAALETAKEFSLERWRDTIAAQLHTAWAPYGP